MICFQAFEEVHVYVVGNLLSQVICNIFLCFNFISIHYHIPNKKKTKNYLR